MGLILDGTTGISASGNIYGGNVIVTGDFTPTALSVVGNVQGAYIKGNGSQLTGLPAGYANSDAAAYLASGTVNTNIITSANITGGNLLFGSGQVSGTGSMYATAFVGSLTGTASVAVSASGTAATVTTAAQPNITSTGTLTSVTSSGLISTTGNVSGNVFIGNGAVLTDVVAISATGTAATVTTAAQPNITSVGTLSSLSVTGNINGGNIITTGTVSVGGFTIDGNTITAAGPTLTIDPNGAGGTDGLVVITGNLQVQGNATFINSNNITTNDLTINMANNAATASAANGGGIEVGPAGAPYTTLLYNSSSNIWVASNGLSVVGVVETAGNIAGGNVLYGSGQVSGTGSIYATAFVGSLTGTASVAVSASGTAATVTTAAQPNITSVGTLGSVYVSGAISVGGGIVNTAGNGVGNIGATGAYFNTVFAKATSAQYADLAEKYTADAEYAPGTVVSFGGSAEVTQSIVNGDRRVAGVVSTNPSYTMNSGLTGTVAIVALTGRVPTSVTGQVRKGDLMVSNGDGSARAEAEPQVGAVIGKALEDFTGETGTIEVVIGRL